MNKELEILKNLSKYLQLKIDSGEHKIIYNDLMQDEKTIDCINAIETLIQALENSIDKSVVEEKIEELDEELEQMKVDNMYGRYKGYGGKAKWERLFANKYGMHDILQELLQEKGENNVKNKR